MIKQVIFDNVADAINKAVHSGALGQIDADAIQNICVEKPRNTEFGDFAVNVSPLARFAKMPPAKIAEIIVSNIDIVDTQINVVAGFINFKLGKSWLNIVIKEIIDENNDYGRNNFGNSERVMLEYVSANPTGPLHIGHGRWAAVGSSLANIMKFSGYDLYQEFYINDTGTQINNLCNSLMIRILQQKGGKQEIPTDEIGKKNFYPGEYLVDLAKKFVEEKPDKAQEIFDNFGNTPYDPEKGTYPFPWNDNIKEEISSFAISNMLEEQKKLLSKLRVEFDEWFSESTLHKRGEVEETVEKLKSQGEIYEKDGALWFRSSKYGDDQDRVIKKANGFNTYLTADIAYHYDKIKRGFYRFINIWGADHHGYVARIRAAIEALGYDGNRLEVLLGQLVNLIVDGEAMRMGKRKKMYTLEELVDEVGVDATRFWMVMRSTDTTLDFDINLAKSCSDENPVYYVQYAHARSASILRTATSDRLDQDTRKTLPPFITKEELEELTSPSSFSVDVLNALWNTPSEKELESTKTLILKLESFQETVVNAAKFRAPHQIARYMQELASDFHYFYTFTRVLNIEEPVMKARLCLIQATKQVLFNSLNLLSVTAPDSM